MEPGRSIVADAGMTVYTVCSVKRIPGYKSYVITDGGMTDNPRYCLYGSRYTVLHAEKRSGLRAIFDLAGRCCESGDILQPAVSLPANTGRGDRIAVCTTGAYNYSLSAAAGRDAARRGKLRRRPPGNGRRRLRAGSVRNGKKVAVSKHLPF